MYLSEKHRDTDREIFLLLLHTPDVARAGLSQLQANSLEGNLDLSHGRQEPKYWSHHALPFMNCISQEAGIRLGPSS